MSKIKWSKKINRDSTYGHWFGYIGDVEAFAIWWSIYNEPCHNLECRLPGVIGDLGQYATLQAAKDEAEAALCSWLESAKLEEIKNDK